MEVTFSIYKEEVYKEVAQTSSYTGAKMDDDANAYERIFTTDEDQSQLERFWNESCVTFCEIMKRYLMNDEVIRQAVIIEPKATDSGQTSAQSAALAPGVPVDPGILTPITAAIIGHRFDMDFSKSFDSALVPSMRQELFSYFVMNITAKWYGFTNKKESGEYAAAAATLLEGIHRKACFKRKPQRPTY